MYVPEFHLFYPPPLPHHHSKNFCPSLSLAKEVAQKQE